MTSRQKRARRADSGRAAGPGLVGGLSGPPRWAGRGGATPTGPDDYAVRIEPVAVWIDPVAVRTDAVAAERRRSALAV